jgi:hypothetical protein
MDIEGKKFKAYTHFRLDQIGVPERVPESQHDKEGCRVGGRFDWLYTKLLTTVNALKAAQVIREYSSIAEHAMSNEDFEKLYKAHADFDAAMFKLEEIK